MQNLILIKAKTSSKKVLSEEQQIFKKLKKQIDDAQKKIEKEEKALQCLLKIYYKEIPPLQKKMGKLHEAQFLLLSAHRFNTKKLSTKERLFLMQHMENLARYIFQVLSPDETSEEFRTMLKEVFPPPPEKPADSKEQEPEEDFSFSDEEEESESKGKSFEDLAEELFRKKFTSSLGKKQEPLQKKEMGAIYKQLAKEIHPDLEQDPKKKAEKMELMKKLTTAYKENDMHTLLSLEISITGSREHSNEKLKIYNNTLKVQMQQLQMKLNTLHLQHPYAPIADIAQAGKKRRELLLNESIADLEETVFQVLEINTLLEGNQAIKTIKMLIGSY